MKKTRIRFVLTNFLFFQGDHASIRKKEKYKVFFGNFSLWKQLKGLTICSKQLRKKKIRLYPDEIINDKIYNARYLRYLL